MSPSHKQPNLVLVMTDQHRWDCLSIAGHPHVMTPNLDSLAMEGEDTYILFFNLEKDPMECRNLANIPGYSEEVAVWRNRLIQELGNRPEGFTDG